MPPWSLFLGGHRVPGGEAQFRGDPKVEGGRGGILLLSGKRASEASTYTPRSRAVARVFRGPGPDDTRKTTVGKFGGPRLSYKGK